MKHLIDLYAMTPVGLIFLAAYIIPLVMEWRLLGWYYGMCYKRAWGEERRLYREELKRLNDKLREYERTHRTLC